MLCFVSLSAMFTVRNMLAAADLVKKLLFASTQNNIFLANQNLGRLKKVIYLDNFFSIHGF